VAWRGALAQFLVLIAGPVVVARGRVIRQAGVIYPGSALIRIAWLRAIKT
jgi:hypothetical protein